MGVMVQCPICRVKQSVNNKRCKCGEDLVKAKRSKRVKYWIYYRIPGSRRLHNQIVGDDLQDAKDAFAKRMVQKREHKFFDMLPKANLTFAELFKWYFELPAVKALGMFEVSKIHAAHFLKKFGDLKANALKSSQLTDYQTELTAAGLSASYVDQILGTAKAMMNKAFRDFKVSGDALRPFKLLQRTLKRGSNAREVALTFEQYTAIMANLPRHLAPIFATGYWTGMRLGEILGLTWDRIDLRAEVIHLRPRDTKDREPRRIPILEPLLEIIKAIPRKLHEPRVFLFAGKPLRDIRDGLRRACKDAGVPYGRRTAGGFVFHDLRHTFVTNMRRAGVHDTVIMQITGHADLAMFRRYNLVDDQDAKRAAKKLTDYLTP